MSNSPLVSYTKLSPNCTKPRQHAIDMIAVHCLVGQVTAREALNWKDFTVYDEKKGRSCNYLIGTDGGIGLCVPEAYRAWCTGGKLSVNGITGRMIDHRAISIECASDLHSPYAVNDKAYAALIDLLTDICKRNHIERLLWKNDKSLVGKPELQNIAVHRWFANKACPGNYLMNNMGDIATEVNKRLENKTMSELPKEAYGVKTQEPAPWAKEDWSWAKEAGLLDGRRPLVNVTRQEMAVFGKRMYEMMKK